LGNTNIDELLRVYAQTHLICDSAYPIITNSTFAEEAILTNLDIIDTDNALTKFNALVNKSITISDDITHLSGGQKVLLMIILALYSKANRICFTGIYNCLDDSNKTAVKELLNDYKLIKDDIVVLD
jgi:ABC-type iron transport system FetAB ATPase subunit